MQNSPSLFHKIKDIKEKKRIFALWQESFIKAHSFMGEALLERIARDLWQRVQKAECFLAQILTQRDSTDSKGSKDSLTAFGIYTLCGDSCHFECYLIDRNVSQTKVIQAFCASIKATHSKVRRFLTQWDTHDTKGLQAFSKLGFIQSAVSKDTLDSKDMVALCLEADKVDWEDSKVIESKSNQGRSITDSDIIESTKPNDRGLVDSKRRDFQGHNVLDSKNTQPTGDLQAEGFSRDFGGFSSECAGSYLNGSDQTRTQKSTKSTEKPTPLQRCGWIYQGYNTKDYATQKLYQNYHDFEWGVPQYEDKRLFEQLVLEGMQAGLSWITILKKREALRAAFGGFEPAIVAGYDEAKIQSLMANTAIIRNRAKIGSAINNAKRFLEVQAEFGSFASFIWGYVGGKPITNHFENLAEIPTRTPLSDTITRDLKRRGFSFVGSVGIYAFMQSVGMVCDHLVSCAFHPENAGKKEGCKPYILETERVYLRRYRDEDLEALHRILSDEETMYAWGHGFSIDESREWLERQLASYQTQGFGRWAVVDKTSGEIIGDAGLKRELELTKELKIQGKITEFAYLLKKEHWGKGLGTEIALAVRDYAFTNLGLSKVYCLVKTDNVASIKVAKKLKGELLGEHIKIYQDRELPHYVFECKNAEIVFECERVDKI